MLKVNSIPTHCGVVYESVRLPVTCTCYGAGYCDVIKIAAKIGLLLRILKTEWLLLHLFLDSLLSRAISLTCLCRLL